MNNGYIDISLHYNMEYLKILLGKTYQSLYVCLLCKVPLLVYGPKECSIAEDVPVFSVCAFVHLSVENFAS